MHCESQISKNVQQHLNTSLILTSNTNYLIWWSMILLVEQLVLHFITMHRDPKDEGKIKFWKFSVGISLIMYT